MKSYWAVLPVIIALSIFWRSEFWILLCVIIDYYTPWVAFESPLYHFYHKILVSRLSEKPEIPLLELTAAEATHDRVFAASKGYTEPIVIRNLLGNSSAVQNWANPDWWINNYGDEELLCGTLNEVEGEECTVKGFFNSLKAGKPFYVSGASSIFERHPELFNMIDNEATRAIEPAFRTASQIFMGLPDMGSDIHCAIGINVFRQIVGQKKWWFIPPHQTKYLKPSWNSNGFSAHTMTKVGKGGEEPSPWLSKLVRYTTVLSPGDVLLNPPWYWHGIINQGVPGSQDLVIGSPVRFSKDAARNAAFKTNFAYTTNALWVVYLKYGIQAFRPGFKPNLEKNIAENRKSRDVELDNRELSKRAKLVDSLPAATGGKKIAEEADVFDEAE